MGVFGKRKRKVWYSGGDSVSQVSKMVSFSVMHGLVVGCPSRSMVYHSMRSSAICPLHISISDDPISRLASDVVGGKSGRNHATSRRHPIHIGRMARNAYIRVGWYEDYSLVGTVKEYYLLQLLVALYTFGSRSAGVPCQIIPHARSSPIR